MLTMRRQVQTGSVSVRRKLAREHAKARHVLCTDHIPSLSVCLALSSIAKVEETAAQGSGPSIRADPKRGGGAPPSLLSKLS
eukprot:scaffold7040_cov256-Pinguiococcus_pyrenoidosus.AAC.9